MVRVLLIGNSVGIVIAAMFLSIGIYSQKEIFYQAAIWALAVLAVLTLFIVVKVYHRIVHRIGTANKRLAELRFLQERRYGMLSARLDHLIAAIRELGVSQVSPDKSRLESTRIFRKQLVELEDLNARLERAERRILGKIENQIFVNDSQYKRVDRFASDTDEY